MIFALPDCDSMLRAGAGAYKRQALNLAIQAGRRFCQSLKKHLTGS